MPTQATLPKPISISFSGDEDRDDFTRVLASKIQAGVDQRLSGGFDDSVREYRDQYDGTLPVKTEPWDNCSNLNVPFSQPVCDSLHAHLYKTLTGVEPYFRGSTPRAQDQQHAELQEQALQWIMQNDVHFAKVVDEALLRALIDKVCILSPIWEVKIEKRRKLEKLTPELRAELAQQQPDVSVDGYQDGDYVRVTREEATKNGVTWRIIDVLDFGTYPADISDITVPSVLFNRYWATESDLRQGVKNGRYDKRAVSELLQAASNSPPRNDEMVGGDIARFDSDGILTDAELTAREKPYQVFQGLYKWDEDGDGIDEWILFELEFGSRKLLSAMVYPYDHGEPFYVPFSPFIKPGHLYPYSLMEKLSDHQDALNAMQNQRFDRRSMEISAPLVASTQLKRQIGAEYIQPGKVFFADTPKDAIVPVSLANGATWTNEEIQYMVSSGFSIAGVNETTVGQQAQGGDKTADEIDHILQSTNVKFDVMIDRLRDELATCAQQTVGLEVQFMPDSYEFNVDGEWDSDGLPIFKSISREQMMTHTGFTVHGTSSLSNPALQMQIAEKLVMFSERSPFIQTKLTRQWQVAQHYLRSSGIKDYVRYIGTFDEAKQMEAAAAQAPPPPPERKISVTEARDEVLTLADALKNGDVNEVQYMAAALLARHAAEVMLPPQPGARVADATDNPAGYQPVSPSSANGVQAPTPPAQQPQQGTVPQ